MPEIYENFLPLYLTMEGTATEQEMNTNSLETLKRGYQGIKPYLDSYDGAVSIVGAGPSLERTYKELRGDVLACNSAIGYLLEHGVVPRWAMIWDAHPLVEKFAVPHPDVTYFVAARCHPSVFERLKDCKVVSWFAGGDHNIAQFMLKNRIADPMVNGGSAAVTRSMFLAFALGYREFHIFGADSSYSDEGATHVAGSVVPEKDLTVWIGNKPGMARRFRTTPEWCAQVEEFKIMFETFHNNLQAKIYVYGDGMLQHVARILWAQRITRKEYQKVRFTQPLEVSHAGI